MRVKWRPLAEQDMDDIVDFIVQDNPVAAIEVGDEIVRQVAALAEQPEIGRRGRIQGTRELVINRLSYVVPFRAVESVVEILRVYHTARQWPVLLAELEGVPHDPE